MEEKYKLNKYQIHLPDGTDIPVNEKIYQPPVEFGRVAPYITRQIVECYSNSTSFTYLDFSHSVITEKIPLIYCNKENIDGISIFNPFGSRITGLCNDNLLSQCIVLDNLLKYFGYNLVKDDFNGFYQKMKILQKVIPKDKRSNLFLEFLLYPTTDRYLDGKFYKFTDKEMIKDFWLKNISPIYNIFEFRNNPFILRNFLHYNKSAILENSFAVIFLDLSKMSLSDSKWLAEIQIITRLHNHIIKHGSEDFNLFIIDDDLDIIDIRKIVNIALTNFDKKFEGKINIILQKGIGVDYPSELYESIPSSFNEQVAPKLIELSNLRDSTPIDEYCYDFILITNCHHENWENGTTVEHLINNDYSKLGEYYAHREVLFEFLPNNQSPSYPLGIIENLQNYIS